MYTVIENDQGAAGAVKWFLKKILSEDIADAVFTAARSPYSSLPMPMLISDPDHIDTADPFAPVAPFNAARQAAALLRHDVKKRIAFVLRPCEMRALVELTKLKQAVLTPGIFIGLECYGRMENPVYLELMKKHADLSPDFFKKDEFSGMVCSACSACDRFTPMGTDLTLSVFGTDLSRGIGIFGKSATGQKILEDLNLPAVDPSADHGTEIEAMLQKRSETRSLLMERTSEKIKDINGFETLIADCLNCYNCRVACPVCYCKECVFLTDVFAHEPELLLRRASKRGVMKMPTETTMFHLTRLSHIGHACVACGHCSSVCPSNIPVADFFITVGTNTQELFEYEPGRDVNEPIPYLVFEEESKSED